MGQREKTIETTIIVDVCDKCGGDIDCKKNIHRITIQASATDETQISEEYACCQACAAASALEFNDDTAIEAPEE